MVAIQKPATLDVTRSNPIEFIYLKGSEFVDDSVRLSIDLDTQLSVIQKRIEAIWQPSSFITNVDSIRLGLNVALGGIGHFLVTEAADGRLHFHAHSVFDGQITTVKTRVIFAISFDPGNEDQPDFSGEFTGTEFGFNQFLSRHAIVQEVFWKTGSTAATAIVRWRIYRGEDSSGVLIFDQQYPPSNFPANSDIGLVAAGYIEFEDEATHFVRLTSDEDFSILTNAAVTEAYQRLAQTDVRYNQILATAQFKPFIFYNAGQFFVDHATDKIFVCNRTLPQSGTFEDNSFLWNPLIAGNGANDFDFILNTVEGDSIADNEGDIVIGI